MRVATRQLLLSLFAAAFGVTPTMLVLLRRFYGILGYRGKLEYLAIWNVAHSVVLFALLLWWFGEKRPNLKSSQGIFLTLCATLVGTMLAIVLPYAGIGLIVTGQALLNAFTAAFTYAALAPRFVGIEIT
jgi:hypothetical protein